MAVYLTNKMLTKLNKNKYYTNVSQEDELSTSGDHWHRLYNESKSGVNLAREMICRVCARSGCTPLSEKLNGCDIMGAVRSITNLSISTEDSLPKYICTECLEILKMAVAFKKNCETADRKFKQILNPMGDPSIHSYPYSKHDFQLILHEMKMKRKKMEEKLERERRKKERFVQKRICKEKEQFKCSPCDICFSDKEKLLAHRRERQCMKRACDICGQLVLSISQHMRHIHKQNTVHKCPTCGKEFPIIARLKNHMLVHTNTFNFFCDLCPYKCKHKYYLVMHMRTHTGEKPYKCSQCPATFVNPSNLNKHKLTHQDKQFKCTMCEKAFRTSTALREHQEAAHMNIKHTCTYCGRDFCYKSDLRKHEIRNHNRLKRDYVGGEPTYKLLERMQKLQDDNEVDKWPHTMSKQLERMQKLEVENPVDKWPHTVTVGQQPSVNQPSFIEQNNVPPPHIVYFSEVQGLIQQQDIVPTQTVHLTLPELVTKKDEVKVYEVQKYFY